MQSNHKPTVTFDSEEQIFNTDSGDELEVDEDVCYTENQTANNSKTSSAVRSEGGDMNSESSISTSILDDAEEVKVLRRKLADAEARCKLLEYEVEKSNCCLLNERNHNAKLEKKLQFVKDNQEVFIRLKEAYINMKYNEAAGRKMIEIREKGMQTWEGILCRGCIEAEELRRQMDNVKESYKNSCIVAPYEVDQLINTVKYLKELIDRREKSWAFNADRENLLQATVKNLEIENNSLRDLIRNKDDRLDEDQIVDETNIGEVMINKVEIAQLKKIIIKYEKKIRELDMNNTGDMKYSPTLNEKEKKLVQQLMLKYNSRIQKKSRSVSREPNIELSDKKNVIIKCKNEYKNRIEIKAERCRKQTEQPRIEKNPDVAIMMMDYLFETENN